MDKVYWTMKNGEKIDIDEMDINHLRNTLKMLIRNNRKEFAKLFAEREANKVFAEDIARSYDPDEDDLLYWREV